MLQSWDLFRKSVCDLFDQEIAEWHSGQSGLAIIDRIKNRRRRPEIAVRIRSFGGQHLLD